MTGGASETGKRIADALAACDVKLVASLPDNWLMELINTVARDDRFVHVPVNREESAIGLCSALIWERWDPLRSWAHPAS